MGEVPAIQEQGQLHEWPGAPLTVHDHPPSSASAADRQEVDAVAGVDHN